MLRALLPGIIAGYGIAIPVGAVAVLIVETGTRRGFHCAACAGAVLELSDAGSLPVCSERTQQATARPA